MAHQNDTTITAPKPKKSLLKKRISSMFGTPLDQVKMEVSLSDSESDEEKTIENAVENVIETIIEKVSEIDLDIDIEIKKKKNSKDSIQNSPNNEQTIQKPQECLDDTASLQERERKEKKLERNREKASRARNARVAYANVRFETKAKIYMEEQLRIKEQQDAIYKENEQLRRQLQELEINSNLKNIQQITQKPVITQQPKKNFTFL